MESQPDRLVFEVTAAATAPVGPCGIRAATRDGLSNAVLFLVDDLPVQAGARGDRPMRVSPPLTVHGSLREAAVDRYQISVQAGERLSFEAVANRFGKDADPLLTIRDASGAWIAEYDNNPGFILTSAVSISSSRRVPTYWNFAMPVTGDPSIIVTRCESAASRQVGLLCLRR